MFFTLKKKKKMTLSVLEGFPSPKQEWEVGEWEPRYGQGATGTSLPFSHPSTVVGQRLSSSVQEWARWGWEDRSARVIEGSST